MKVLQLLLALLPFALSAFALTTSAHPNINKVTRRDEPLVSISQGCNKDCYKTYGECMNGALFFWTTEAHQVCSKRACDKHPETNSCHGCPYCSLTRRDVPSSLENEAFENNAPPASAAHECQLDCFKSCLLGCNGPLHKVCEFSCMKECHCGLGVPSPKNNFPSCSDCTKYWDKCVNKCGPMNRRCRAQCWKDTCTNGPIHCISGNECALAHCGASYNIEARGYGLECSDCDEYWNTCYRDCGPMYPHCKSHCDRLLCAWGAPHCRARGECARKSCEDMPQPKQPITEMPSIPHPTIMPHADGDE